jgi:hypothetical protein
MSGTWKGEVTGSSYDDNMWGLSLGYEQTFEQFNDKLKANFKYSSCKCKDEGYDYDYTGFDINGIYQLDKIYAITCGYHNHDIDITSGLKITVTGLIVGIDAIYPISPKAKIGYEFGFSLNGNEEILNYDIDADIYIAKIKFLYAINPKIDFTISYKYTQYDTDIINFKYYNLAFGGICKF